ncbi:3-oxoacyl-[acyl-carrier-protein] synthase-1 [Volucribacter psittacicida]|uniref:3-oxoacyl-[acyl-carrier-protein] synthase-1 n=1 Tax=Volucribacter psittacicida TaxID=203482 RepID=A0A4R1GC26_9PAST|nr:beta-ketoacyl-ACP synthase [Volucribacter psittacicida]TCK01852.1 3-oxoacyl-[acyl-carrier-protein] synthase-1 [Volucribacter psittacicida]
MKVFLNKPAILSSLGEGIAQHIQWLLSHRSSPITLSNTPFRRYQLNGKSGMFGEVNSPLRAFDNQLSPLHRSRNNQLLWHCLAQIEDQIDDVINQFGQARVAVVIGSSTTGVDENIDVFKAGAMSNDWSTPSFKQQQQYFSAPADFVAAQYGLTGLCYSVSTACTSGAKALMTAARLLKNDLCDAVICGGVDSLSPLTISGFASLSVLSAQQTNPFSINRAGINLGEGSAIFVMTKEPLQNDAIELLGYGASSDAYHMSSPHPEGEGAIAAMQQALANAQLSAEQIGWVNLHGTGTLHNDKMESLAVAKVLGTEVPCTSTKPYTGHTLAAAGAIEAAILWGIISQQYNPQGQIPAQLWDKQRDPELPAINLTDHHQYWANSPRIGLSNSFAFGGNNAVLILGESV